MESSPEEISTPKKAPRKRASSTVTGVTRKPVKKRAPRKTTTNRVEPRGTVTPTERKAPTEFGAYRLTKEKQRKHMLVVGGLLIFGVVA